MVWQIYRVCWTFYLLSFQIKLKILVHLEKDIWHSLTDISCEINICTVWVFAIKSKSLDQLGKYNWHGAEDIHCELNISTVWVFNKAYEFGSVRGMHLEWFRRHAIHLSCLSFRVKLKKFDQLEKYIWSDLANISCEFQHLYMQEFYIVVKLYDTTVQ